MKGTNKLSLCMADVKDIFQKHLAKEMFIDSKFEITDIQILNTMGNHGIELILRGTEDAQS